MAARSCYTDSMLLEFGDSGLFLLSFVLLLVTYVSFFSSLAEVLGPVL